MEDLTGSRPLVPADNLRLAETSVFELEAAQYELLDCDERTCPAHHCRFWIINPKFWVRVHLNTSDLAGSEV